MKLKVTTNLTVDGVMQGLGGADEDRSGGFERGGWVTPLVDDETGKHIDEVYGNASAYLFGRRTYEIFARSWGKVAEMKKYPIGIALNSHPKYVVSNTLENPEWEDTTVLRGDIAAAIRDLKENQEGELLVPGSGILVRWLLANNLVDELDLITYPIIVGQGARLFADSGVDFALDLMKAKSTQRGILIQTYKVSGRPEYTK